MTLIVALVWLVAMLGLFGWLLWWDRSDGRGEQPPLPTLETILDHAVTRASNGDEASERLLWETLADDLGDYRDLRVMLEHERDHTRA